MTKKDIIVWITVPVQQKFIYLHRLFEQSIVIKQIYMKSLTFVLTAKKIGNIAIYIYIYTNIKIENIAIYTNIENR